MTLGTWLYQYGLLRWVPGGYPFGDMDFSPCIFAWSDLLKITDMICQYDVFTVVELS